ncbi:Probable transposase [Dorea longicatena]|jgi:putative transposase|uniref:Probable transposase n=1 Tax=Dorea longicatena TaxID=88431 RepID=A0A173RHE4_9FIRM|nr:RNA-guided endonuclease TnpB family protein [Dorea longicatena]CUM77217.1 Probable transposase [Dorea longicatena]
MPNEKKNDEEHGVRLSYKFRIYPTPSQCEAIKANIDASRFVYNHYLRARMDAYERTQQEVRRPKPACDEQGNVQYDQDGKEIWERTEGGKVVFHTVPNPTYDPAAKAMSMFDTSKDLTRLKKELVDEDGKPWLKEADATALIYALRNLDTAYQNFFRGIKKGQDVGFPKFKSRKNPVQTYKSGNVKLAGCDLDDGKAEAAVAEIPSPIPADWDLAGISWNGIVLPKIGKVRARIHRIPEGKFVSCTVERKASGAYYASINVKERELPAYPAATGEVGITFGASHWAVTSDGQVMDLPERIGRLQRRLAIAQRDLARKEPGSQNYLKQKRKVARVNERIADVRKAATHNATRELVNGYGTIAARQMNSKDMQQHGSAATKDLPRKVKKMLNRKMIDGNFAEFNRQLAYKSAWANRSFVEVPGDTPTAQVCSRCGHEELVLARDLRPAWTCSECGAKHDRKANGAQNVLEAGKDILAKQERSFVTKAKKSREKKRATKPISTAREGASR